MIGSAQISAWWFSVVVHHRAREQREPGARGVDEVGREFPDLPAGAAPVTVAAAMNPVSHG